MKATDTKHTSTVAKTSTPQPAQAFFRQGEGSFFSPTCAEPSFFNVQPKLAIGEPGDKFEKEADSMADKVVGQISEPASLSPTGPAATAAGPAPAPAAATPLSTPAPA